MKKATREKFEEVFIALGMLTTSALIILFFVFIATTIKTVYTTRDQVNNFSSKIADINSSYNSRLDSVNYNILVLNSRINTLCSPSPHATPTENNPIITWTQCY